MKKLEDIIRNKLQPVQILLDMLEDSPCNLPADILLQAMDARTVLADIVETLESTKET